jgi:hypothetical protein
VYARRVGDRDYTFGVSGLLYASNVLMYDLQTESLWLQVKRQAVTGPMTGTRLTIIPSTVTTWEKWQKRHPSTLVLSLDTGYDRDYTRDPYASYYRNRGSLFSRLFGGGGSPGDKDLVAGIEIDGAFKAYTIETIRNSKRIEDTLGGRTIVLTWSNQDDSVSVITADGDRVEHLVSYWFVWKDIHPDTAVYTGETGR